MAGIGFSDAEVRALQGRAQPQTHQGKAGQSTDDTSSTAATAASSRGQPRSRAVRHQHACTLSRNPPPTLTLALQQKPGNPFATKQQQQPQQEQGREQDGNPFESSEAPGKDAWKLAPPPPQSKAAAAAPPANPSPPPPAGSGVGAARAPTSSDAQEHPRARHAAEPQPQQQEEQLHKAPPEPPREVELKDVPPTSASDLGAIEKMKRQMEEENARKKAILKQALAARHAKTITEAQKLQQIQLALTQLDKALSNDIAILRARIEDVNRHYSEAQ
jgi:hypothetical protein